MDTQDISPASEAPQSDASGEQSPERIGELFFKYRDYTPVPLILLLLLLAKPTVGSATIGMFLLLCGELIRIYAVAFIGSISRTRKNQTGSNLITTGPFGYVRNPLYVGNFLISFGVAVYGGNNFISVLTVLLFAMQYYFIVKYEENLLHERFGDEYRAYCEQVPAWFPRRSIKLEDLEWPDSFTAAFRSERKTLMAIAAMIIILMLRA